MSNRRYLFSGMAALLVLGACSSYRGLDKERMAGCINGAGITGQYRASFSLQGNRTRVLVYPGAGTTEAQAANANACIARAVETPLDQDFAAETSAQQPYYTKRQRRASALSGGAGYHGSYLEGGTGSGYVTAAPEVVSPAKPAKTVKGKLPLPTQFALLPGDAELWATLTLDQQKRALAFLQDGSTIRSSLRMD